MKSFVTNSNFITNRSDFLKPATHKGYVSAQNIQPKFNNKNEDDDTCDGINPNQNITFYEAVKVNRCITVFLDETVREPKYYRNLLQCIDNLSEDDMLQIVINSYGGALDGAMAIISAIQGTDAHVQVLVDGVAASAASMIALAAPSLFIADNSVFMIHSATFGSVGKQSDVISHVTFLDRRIKSIMQDIYKGFLTDQELQDVLTGREIWLDTASIIERLEARHKQQQDELEGIQALGKPEGKTGKVTGDKASGATRRAAADKPPAKPVAKPAAKPKAPSKKGK